MNAALGCLIAACALLNCPMAVRAASSLGIVAHDLKLVRSKGRVWKHGEGWLARMVARGEVVEGEFALPRRLEPGRYRLFVKARNGGAGLRVSCGGWQWQHTRMADPQRAERLWLAIAVATLWLLRVGGIAEEDSTSVNSPREKVSGSESRCWRMSSVFARGHRVIEMALVKHRRLPLGEWCPESGPELPLTRLKPIHDRKNPLVVSALGGQSIEVNVGQREPTAMEVELLVHATIDDVTLLPESLVDGDCL